MADEYADPDVVRRFARSITTSVITDDDVNLVSSTIVDPVVNAELYGLGGPWTDSGGIPDLIVVAASMMAVGIIFDDVSYQTAAESDWGKKKWDRGLELLAKIKSGQTQVSGVTRPSSLIVSDPTDDKAATAIFTGDPTTWEGRTETKATS